MASECDIYLDISGRNEGPYDLKTVRQLLQSGTINEQTLWARPNSSAWLPVVNLLQEIPPLLHQPLPVTRPAAVWLRDKASGFLVPEEQILAVAAQVMAPLGHDGVVVTNQRLIMLWPSLGGLKLTFSDWLWVDILDVRIAENVLGSSISAITNHGTSAVNRLHKEEARAVYRIAQEHEVEARLHRWNHKIQALKAGAAVINTNTANQTL